VRCLTIELILSTAILESIFWIVGEKVGGWDWKKRRRTGRRFEGSGLSLGSCLGSATQTSGV